jgi:hypothetical protein
MRQVADRAYTLNDNCTGLYYQHPEKCTAAQLQILQFLIEVSHILRMQ